MRGGYNVFPLEVEAVLCEHPAVAHVAVAPRPDPVMGEIGVAVVVVRDGSLTAGARGSEAPRRRSPGPPQAARRHHRGRRAAAYRHGEGRPPLAPGAGRRR